MNKVEFFTEILKSFGTNTDIGEFAKKELAQLQQTPTIDKWQDIKHSILNEMQEGVWYTISDMQTKLYCCNELTNQKISAIVRQMVEAKQIIRSAKKQILGTINIYKLA